MSPSTPPYPPGRQILAGKTVLVTAAAGSGIGFATARRCVEEGARVTLNGRDGRALETALAGVHDLDAHLVEHGPQGTQAGVVNTVEATVDPDQTALVVLEVQDLDLTPPAGPSARSRPGPAPRDERCNAAWFF